MKKVKFMFYNKLHRPQVEIGKQEMVDVRIYLLGVKDEIEIKLVIGKAQF